MKIEDAKVLVVDDDNVMRTYVVKVLMRLGVKHVKDGNDGQQGLAISGSFMPDLILSDIHMAPMDGLEFVKRLRRHPILELRKVPVLFMSADSSTEILNDSVELGIKGYIIKPPVISVLRAKVEQALWGS